MPRRIALLAALVAVAALLTPAAAQASSVINPTASPSTTAAGVQHVRYTVSFTATTSIGGVGSNITLTGDPGTVMPTVAQIRNNTTGTTLSRSATQPGGNQVMQINLCCSDNITSGDSITITVDNVTNPGTGAHAIGVKTSGDIDQVQTPSFVLTSAQQLASVTAVTLSSTAGGIQHVRYSFSFTPSSTGQLVGPGTIDINGPTGTVMPSVATLHNQNTGATFSRSGTHPGGANTLRVALCCTDQINATDTIDVTLDDVTNAATGPNNTLNVSTSSDPTPVATAQYALTAPEQISGLTGVTLSSTASGVQHVRYSFMFNTSANTGGLVAPGTIQIVAPVGTTLPSVAQIRNVSSGATFSRSGVHNNGGNTLRVSLCCSDGISVNQTVEVTLDDVTNTSTGSGNSLSLLISTSSNPTPVGTPAYVLTAPEQVTGVSGVTLSSAAGGVQHVRQSFSFTASGSTGRLVPPATVKIDAPAGTVLPSIATLHNDTTGATFTRSGVRSNSNATLTVSLCCTDQINPGEAVTITLDDVTNPATGGPYSVNVSTSSNPTPVATAGYSLTAPQQVTDVTPATTSTDAHGVLSDSFSFRTSVPNGRLVPPGTVTITGPAGTVMPTVVGLRDVTTGASYTRSAVRSNGNATALVSLCCTDTINPGDTVAVTLSGVTNPPGAVGPFSVSTSSDTGSVTTPPAPAIGKRATAAVEKGLVRVKLPGKKGFVTLTQTTSIPLGSTLDTTKGQVALTFATNAAGTKTQAGSFSQGQFQVQQSKKNPLTTLSMVGAGLNACKSRLPKGGARKPSAGVRVAAKHRRTLFSHVKGRFRTRGRNSTATVRGTTWRVTDTCSGTKTAVTQGTVVVRDLTLRRNIVLKAGHSYLARAPLRKKHH